MLKRKEIISKLLAFSLVMTTFTANASALEPRAAVSSTTLAGTDRYETAVKVSESGWTSATNAVLINGDKGLVDALTATPYASLKNAPILVTEKDKLTTVTKTRLKALGVKNVDIVGGTSVVSTTVENELKSMGLTVKRIQGDDRYKTAVAVANEIKKLTTVNKIAVVNGATGLPDAVSVAAPAADNNMPILLSDPANNNGVKEAKEFISGTSITKSYVIGQSDAVSDSIMSSLPGTKTRLGGTDRHDTNNKVIREFYTSKALDNIYVAKSGYIKNNEELVDALAVGVLAAKNDDPVLIVGKSLDNTQKTLLKEKTFTKITQVGNGIPTQSINDIKDTQKDPEAKVTGVTLVDYKTIKITGTELGRLTSSSITMSGNSVESYTANSAGTEATIVFNNSFADGSNTFTVKNNLGTVTTHSFTYGAAISSVEATTTKVKTSGVQYVEFTVNNGQKRSIEELKALGWTVKFNSSLPIFYSERSTVDGTKPAYTDTTSTTGKLRTSFTDKEVYTYEVVLTKGTQTIKSGLKAFEVSSDLNSYDSIKSYDITVTNGAANTVKIASNTLVKGETANIGNIKAVDKNNNEITLTGSTYTSSNPSVISVDSAGNLTTNSVGSATITIKNGDLTKSFTMYVKLDARKASSVVLDKSSVKIIKAKTDTVVVTVKDQYGDPFQGKSFGTSTDISTTGTPSTQIATATFKNMSDATPAVTNNEGKLKIEILGKTKGNSTLKLTDTSNGVTTVLGNVSVYVSDELTANSWTLSINDSSKDTILDVYDSKSDQTLTLDLNGYNAGYLVGKETSVAIYNTPNIAAPTTGLWVKSSDESIAGVTGGPDGSIIVTAKKAGTVTIQAYKDKTLKSSINITVKDTTPTITSIDMKNTTNITTSGTVTFDVESLFNTTFIKGSTSPAPTYDRTVVTGITLSGTTEEVLLGSSTENGVTRPVLFVDRGTKNGVYDKSTDLVLASINMVVDFGNTVNNNKIVNISANKTGNIIVAIHKGVYNPSENPFISKAITVNTTTN